MNKDTLKIWCKHLMGRLRQRGEAYAEGLNDT